MKLLKSKGLISVAVATSILLCSAVIFCSNAANFILVGDVNLDGEVNAMDINSMKRVLSGSTTLNGARTLAADLNGDGMVNGVDSNSLNRYVSGVSVPPVIKVPNPYPDVPDEPIYTVPTMEVSKVNATKGGTVEVTVNLYNNPGILAMQLSLDYDAEALTLVDAMEGSALSDLMLTKPGKFTSPCNFVWDGVEVNDPQNGIAITFVFAVNENAAAGEYDISLAVGKGSVIDNDLNVVDLDIVNGSVTVK